MKCASIVQLCSLISGSVNSVLTPLCFQTSDMMLRLTEYAVALRATVLLFAQQAKPPDSSPREPAA